MTSDSTTTTPRVTLGEVATAAGVSRAAASLALRGKPGVAEDTRQRILDIAAGLGYRVRPFAVTLPAGTVGILVKSKPADMGSTNAFYAPVLAGISRSCAELDLDLRLDSVAVDEHFDPTEVPRMIQTGDVHGLIILGAFLSLHAAAMIGSQPVILVDGYSDDPSRFASVVSDNVGGTARATQHLIGLGHRRIAMVGTSATAFPSILGRRRGYASAMAEAGLEPVYLDARHDDPTECTQAVVRALAAGQRLTALVAANDAVALALLAELRDRVPAEISLVGFDDIEAASMVWPRLTTVGIDKEAMGRLAVSLLRHRIAYPDDPGFTVVQQAQLVVRDSTAQPPA